MEVVRLLFCCVIFNCIDIIFPKSSFTCCEKSGYYYECRNCRSILFAVENDVTVKLLSSRTNFVEVLRGSIDMLFVETDWQYRHLCSLHIKHVAKGTKNKSCGKYIIYICVQFLKYF